MYFWGIHVQPKKERAILSLVQKSQKHLKKKYRLEALLTVAPVSGSPSLLQTVVKLYKDRKWSIRKRLYSQDRRPTRSIRAYPTMVVCGIHEDASSLVTALRKAAVPIQAIFTVPDGSWRKVDYGRALGHDYYVSMAALEECSEGVFGQNRLNLGDAPGGGEAIAGHCGLVAALEAYLEAKETGGGPATTVTDALPAVAAPLWFRETIPYRRAYCSR